ncbi:phage portal protein, partial [candidate division WOR-3 bacterium]|nr:phage portal protein [candidate division WOR-3 bacterium]
MLEGLKSDIAVALNRTFGAFGRFIQYHQKGIYSFDFSPIWGRFEKVKPGDIQSMIQAHIGWVYACVDVLAKNVAKVPMRIYRPTEYEDKLIKGHPFYKLLKHPNKFQSSYDILYLMQAYLDLTGSTYLYHPFHTFNRPAELWVLPSQAVTMKIENNVRIYEYTGQGGLQVFSDEEITHIKYPNPSYPLRGLSPLEAARESVNLLTYMGQYSLSLIANRARPDAILSTEQSVSPEEAKRVRIDWKAQFGGIDKIGEMAVMGQGLKYTPLSMSPTDIQYLESRKFTQEEISAIFNVPPYKLGRTENVNRSNAHELEHSFQKDTISPRLWLRDMYLTDELLKYYDSSLIVKSDDVVPIDKEFQKEQEKMDLTHAVITINEVRQRRGMKPVPYGDKPLVP